MTYLAGGVTLPHAPIMIGAGACKTPQKTFEWLSVAPVVSGSYTPDARPGNSGNRLNHPDLLEEFLEERYGLNAFGMPNMGFASAARELNAYGGVQPLIISVAGFSVDDYIEGLRAFDDVKGVKAFELNFGCPNTGHGRIMSFDLASLAVLCKEMAGRTDKPIWAKFSPYSDPGQLKEVAQVVNDTPAIHAVVTCNTFPNAYAGSKAISYNNGLAGLSGPALKPIAMGQVMQFRQHLSSRVDVIGVGGITTGNDAVDFLRAGARAVQCTSLPFWMGEPSRFLEHLLAPETGRRLETYLTN